MSEKDKEVKVEFAPGAFDHFEGTQEELDELLAEIHKMFEGKSFEEIAEMSRPLSEEDLDELPPEVVAQLLAESLGEDGEDLAEEFKRKLQ